MRAFVRRHPFFAFYALALTIGSAVVVWRYYYAIGYLARTGHPFDYNQVLWDGLLAFNRGRMYANVISIAWVAAFREPIYFGVFLFAGSPTISAIVISYVGWGWDGLKRLFARIKLWPSRGFRNGALVTYGVITAVFAVFTIVHLVLIKMYVGPEALHITMTPFGLPIWLYPLAFLIGGLIDEGGTNEELGWRGFGLPTLLDRTPSALIAALLLGFLWWAWHFPREVPALIAHGMPDGFIVGQLEFMLLVIAMSVVMTFLYHRTGGSVIPGLLLHGWGNYLTKGVSLYPTLTIDDRNWLFFASAVLVLLFTGPSLGRKRYLAIQQSEGNATAPSSS